jgi:hypothetical protein
MNTNTSRFIFWRSPLRSSVGRSFSAFAQTIFFVLSFASILAFAQPPQPPPQEKPKNVQLLTGENHANLLKDVASEKEIKTRKQAEADRELQPYASEYDRILTEACEAAYAKAEMELGECQADLSLKDSTGKVVGGVWPKPKPEPKPAPQTPPTTPAPSAAPTPAGPQATAASSK